MIRIIEEMFEIFENRVTENQLCLESHKDIENLDFYINSDAIGLLVVMSIRADQRLSLDRSNQRRYSVFFTKYQNFYTRSRIALEFGEDNNVYSNMVASDTEFVYRMKSPQQFSVNDVFTNKPCIADEVVVVRGHSFCFSEAFRLKAKNWLFDFSISM